MTKKEAKKLIKSFWQVARTVKEKRDFLAFGSFTNLDEMMPTV